MLGFADIYFNVVCFSVLANYHTGVNFLAGADKEDSTFLGAVETVGYGFSGFKCNQRSLFAVLNIAFVWGISVKCCLLYTSRCV